MGDIDESKLQAAIDALHASATTFSNASHTVQSRAQHLFGISLDITYNVHDWGGTGSEAFQHAWGQFDQDSCKAVNALSGTATALNKLAQKLQDALDAKRQAERSQGLMILGTIGLGILDVAQLGLDPVTDAATVGMAAGAVAEGAVDIAGMVAEADVAAEAELAGIETTEVGTLETLDEGALDFSADGEMPAGGGADGGGPRGPRGPDEPGGGGGGGDGEGDNSGGSGGDKGGSGSGGNNLPSTTKESVTQKLDKYLLNSEHPVGGSKAEWFRRALGFTKENAADLAKQIMFDESSAVQTEVTQFGTKFNQIISIKGANGRVIDVLFAWIRNNDGIVRLITATPVK